MRQLRRLLLVCLLAVSASSAAAQSPPDAAVSAAIRPVVMALENARARMETLPPAKSDAEKLVRMAELEQAPREALSSVDFGKLTAQQREAAWSAISDLLRPVDASNQAQLLKMAPAEGWFAISRYGADAAKAAFLIVQHGDAKLWRRFLPSIERMVKSGEAEAPAYALMYDRLALSEGRPQRYGSQMECRNGRYAPAELFEDPAGVDERRKALGLRPYGEYLKLFEGSGC